MTSRTAQRTRQAREATGMLTAPQSHPIALPLCFRFFASCFYFDEDKACIFSRRPYAQCMCELPRVRLQHWLQGLLEVSSTRIFSQLALTSLRLPFFFARSTCLPFLHAHQRSGQLIEILQARPRGAHKPN